jgi:hypothetical protein
MSSTHCTQITLTDGREVCLSYGVPVAAFIPGTGYVRTNRKYSMTTSRHANQYCDQREVTTLEDDAFMALVAPVTVGTHHVA